VQFISTFAPIIEMIRIVVIAQTMALPFWFRTYIFIDK
jgi:hypothetical protein